MSNDPDTRTEAKAANTPAEAAARAWLHAYGVHTEMYRRGGSDHPAMRSLPQAFMAFAAAENTRLHAELAASAEALERMNSLINTPTTDNWVSGVRFEAAHQQERWGSTHDAGKTPFDWFWLIGYLAQKAASSAVAGDTEKAMHHTISTAAALLNRHRAISGEMTGMRPGVAASETPHD